MPRGGGPRRRRRWPWLVAISALAVLIGAAAWVGVRAALAKSELEAMRPLAAAAQDAVGTGDVAALRAAVGDLRVHADRAAALTSDPVWRATEGVPWLGPNTAAVRVTAASLRDVADAAGPLLEVLTAHPASADAQGWDLDVLTAAQGPLAALSHALTSADADFAGIDESQLLSPVRDGVATVSAPLSRAAPIAEQAASAASVLPAVLGADGPRTILLMVQNPAEVRTAGGLAGSFVLLTADQGRVTLAAQADSTRFPPSTSPSPLMPSAALDLYGQNAGRYVQNITMTPDFGATAQLALQWWATVSESRPDVVVSIDPLVLAALLAPTGPVTLADGSALTAETLTDRLLVQPYLTMSGEEQTAFQQEATLAVFTRLLAGPPDPAGWATALIGPIRDGRISMWSARPDEEQVLASSALGGQLERLRGAGAGAVGVYLNDATTGKMDSFLDTTVRAGVSPCTVDDGELVVEVTLTSQATDAARSYPPLMAGTLDDGTPVGDIVTNVAVAAPPGYRARGVFLDGAPTSSRGATDGDRPTSVAQLRLAPGTAGTLAFHFLAEDAASAPAAPVIVLPPLLRPATIVAGLESACS